MIKHSYTTLFFLFLSFSLFAQEKKKEVLLSVDSSITKTAIIDSSAKGEKVKKVREYSPKKAALRSALIPGWGQVYNRKYWKLPAVYGLLGFGGYYFSYNFSNYKNTRFAYKVKYNMRVNHTDTALFAKVKAELQPLSEESLRFYRDGFRRDIDYAVLLLVVFWGLNVVDAAVDAHLKAFDVSPDLSMEIKPGYSNMAGTNGLSVVFNIGANKKKALLPTHF